MKKIYKYALEVVDEQAITMPMAARILTVQVQRGKPCVWAEIGDVEAFPTTRTFYTFATGEQLPDGFEKLDYVGTYQLRDETFVGHVYVDRIQ